MKSCDFIYQRSRYFGHFTPENLAFNANLQDFSQKVSYICCLQTGGKIAPEVAYQEIRALWQQLKQAKKQLDIGEMPAPTE
ncbi:DUF7219 family protein [Kamptonema formosum]|uniref:DUF7219 family protein n=1 Tax=Kamptonema formosum TaxID=331992 RepID=UPI0003456D5A|nr:hypothetical protein [Oscillatoria sp. PCC 10802]